MVQVLPYVPSFLETLTPHINQAAQGIGAAIGKNQRSKADQSILQQLQAGQVSPATSATLWSKLSPEAQKTYEPYLQSQIRQQEATQKEGLKRETAAKEKSARYGSVISTGEEMLGMLPDETKSNLPYSPSFVPTTESIEKKEYFDTLSASMVSLFRDLESKGQLPLGLFEKVIEKKLPDSNLSVRENKGRIKAAIALAKKYGGEGVDKKSETGKEGKLTQGQSFEKLPDASEHPNAIFSKGEKKYRSNGKNWTEI